MFQSPLQLLAPLQLIVTALHLAGDFIYDPPDNSQFFKLGTVILSCIITVHIYFQPFSKVLLRVLKTIIPFQEYPNLTFLLYKLDSFHFMRVDCQNRVKCVFPFSGRTRRG